MFSVRLMRMVEDHAEELTRSVLKDLGKNPRIPAYHQVSPERLHERVYEAFRNFARWLGYRTEGPLEKWCGELG